MEAKENKKIVNLNIYGDILSQPARSLVAFCKINNIPHNFNLINLGRGEHLTEDYKKINPFGKIPAISLELEGNKKFNLAESCTILRFLCDYYQVDEVWYPRQDRFRRALIDQWLDWHHLNSRFAFSHFCFAKLFKKSLEKKGIPFRETYDTEKMVEKVLKFLDKMVANKKYIVDDNISVADLILVPEINQLILANYDLSKYENLEKYVDRVNSLSGMKEVNEKLKAIGIKLKFEFNTSKF